MKDSAFSTTGTTYLVNKHSDDVKLFGAQILNLAMGGVNPYAVQGAIVHGNGAKDLDSYAKTRGTAYGISFEAVCQEVMGPVQARQLRRLIGVTFQPHPKLNWPEFCLRVGPFGTIAERSERTF